MLEFGASLHSYLLRRIMKIQRQWLSSRLEAGEQLINKLGIGKTFDKEEPPPPLDQIPKPLPPSHQDQVAKVPFNIAIPKDGYAFSFSRNMAKRARTCVFWDTRAYPLPPGLHSFDVWQNIKDALSERGYFGYVSITSFLDVHPCPPGFSGCDNVSYLKDGDRDARHWQIALRLLAAARCTSIEPVNHMLLLGDISGHIELLRIIYLLNLRFSYNVILAQPPCQNDASSGGQLLGKDGICSSLSAGDKLLSQIEQKMKTSVPPLTPWQVLALAVCNHDCLLWLYILSSPSALYASGAIKSCKLGRLLGPGGLPNTCWSHCY
ncbi:Uncharacterized protein Rs2_26820 [Raphanus sativus]|nr:Uncharacterized protein Rs2_26820 [Raphanus sativus]